jgi:hypothetical protein
MTHDSRYNRRKIIKNIQPFNRSDQRENRPKRNSLAREEVTRDVANRMKCIESALFINEVIETGVRRKCRELPVQWECDQSPRVRTGDIAVAELCRSYFH